MDGRGNLVLLVGKSVLMLRWKTDSIHLAPQSIDDDADSLIAGNGIVRVPDI